MIRITTQALRLIRTWFTASVTRMTFVIEHKCRLWTSLKAIIFIQKIVWLAFKTRKFRFTIFTSFRAWKTLIIYLIKPLLTFGYTNSLM